MKHKMYKMRNKGNFQAVKKKEEKMVHPDDIL